VTKSVLALALLATAAFVHAPVSAQTTQNGPYYATPSWSQTLPASTRFIVLSNFNNAAVLDRETGLVWQRNPTGSAQNWVNAAISCHTLNGTLAPGGRLGWRLPSVEELGSLMDQTQPDPPLPAGHPFQGIEASYYWTATTAEGDPEVAYTVDFFFGGAFGQASKSALRLFVWCVRGGSSIQSPQ
jgi:Protein of unknown function (DUF1566)